MEQVKPASLLRKCFLALLVWICIEFFVFFYFVDCEKKKKKKEANATEKKMSYSL